jgi:hypothetical protein
LNPILLTIIDTIEGQSTVKKKIFLEKKIYLGISIQSYENIFQKKSSQNPKNIPNRLEAMFILLIKRSSEKKPNSYSLKIQVRELPTKELLIGVVYLSFRKLRIAPGRIFLTSLFGAGTGETRSERDINT